MGSVSLVSAEDSRGDWGLADGIAPLDYAFSLNEILLIQPENIISPTDPGNTVIDLGLAASSSCVRKDGFCGAYHSLSATTQRRKRNNLPHATQRHIRNRHRHRHEEREGERFSEGVY
jgi:hypothetical protein